MNVYICFITDNAIVSICSLINIYRSHINLSYVNIIYKSYITTLNLDIVFNVKSKLKKKEEKLKLTFKFRF